MACILDELDIITGLVNFTNDTKPYHTKIAEITVEFVHTDLINVTVTERLEWQIDIEEPTKVIDIGACDSGYDSHIYDHFTYFPVVEINPATKTLTLMGNQTHFFPIGLSFTLNYGEIDNITGLPVAVPVNVFTGSYVVVSTTLVGGNTNVVVSTFPSGSSVNTSFPPGSYFWDISVNINPFPIVGVITTDDEDESQPADIGSNSFIVDGNVASVFTEGVKISIPYGPNQGIYNVLYGDNVGSQTRIRVIQKIHVTSILGEIIFQGHGTGYDYTYPPICMPARVGSVQPFIVEDLSILSDEPINEFDAWDQSQWDIRGWDNEPVNTFSLNTTNI